MARRVVRRRRMHGLGSAQSRMGKAAKACRGKPGKAFQSCVASHLRGLGGRRYRRR